VPGQCDIQRRRIEHAGLSRAVARLEPVICVKG
jgi:hypothetical protein